MKKIVLTIATVLLIAGLFACTQNASTPAQGGGDAGTPAKPGSGTDNAQSAVPGKPPATPPSEAPQASSSEQPEPGDKIKADGSSVLLQVPSEVRFGEMSAATLINNSGYEISYGASYYFQYYVNGAWAQLKYKEGQERAWIAIAYMTEPGGKMTFDFMINSDDYTIPLGPGEYRLVKDISADNGGNFASFQVTGTFTIK